MTSSHLLRLSTLFLAAVAAVSARANSIYIDASGSSYDDNVRPRAFDETVNAQVGGFGPLDRYFLHAVSFDPTSGQYAVSQGYTGSSGFLAIRFLTSEYDYTTRLTTGTWTVDTAECLGAWADVVGSGTYTRATQDIPYLAHEQLEFLTISGSVDYAPPGSGSAPEPASLAALGIGGFALARRRRQRTIRL